MPVRIAPAGGSSVVEVSGTWTPSSGTPSSIADGATLDAGLLSAWKVADASGIFNSMVDDGTTLDIAFDRGSGGTTSLNLGNAYLTQGRIFYPAQLMGDFEFLVRVDSAANAADLNTEIGLMVGGGNTSNEAHHVTHRAGDWLTTTFAYKRSAAAFTTNKTENGSTGISRSASPYWIGLRRVGQAIGFGEGGTSASPSFTWADEEWDTGGGAVDLGLAFFAGSASAETYRIYEVRLTGSEYTASP